MAPVDEIRDGEEGRASDEEYEPVAAQSDEPQARGLYGLADRGVDLRAKLVESVDAANVLGLDSLGEIVETLVRPAGLGEQKYELGVRSGARGDRGDSFCPVPFDSLTGEDHLRVPRGGPAEPSLHSLHEPPSRCVEATASPAYQWCEILGRDEDEASDLQDDSDDDERGADAASSHTGRC